ncbi:EexN family lipoprotein [Xanthomonas oryzae]|uniref:EexN family lipoprotein n=1 Tax=Xanthomonas oryzae TaxID=347 RepID=UPI000949EA31|nr:EexN family lipoprotein [Xanthomonas oryzae]OLK23340.1 conjugal transfer protein TraG [Xanthomonas oryzae pv. oryzae]OLK44078.1 conjugal transfer protein TraG [Xanthomonas oryzae pv. oryzae]UXW31864.1 EexN family lipoprotein [Xanthomonas oryzae pv. oryzae]UZF09628.1 EexN family lipoprotein [Xanthomonas oryzae pv. oryzae]
MKKLSIVLVVAAVLAGCGENTPVQTVDWYKAHDTERKAMIAKCKADPGELAASPNCINAQQAQNEKELSRRGFLKLPPVNAGKKEE